MSEAEDKYAHLFEEEAQGRNRSFGLFSRIDSFTWLQFDRMFSTRLISEVHAGMQILTIIVAALIVVFAITGAITWIFCGVSLMCAAVFMVVLRISSEAAIVLFRIFEELVLMRRGIDEFNAKVQARSPKA